MYNVGFGCVFLFLLVKLNTHLQSQVFPFGFPLLPRSRSASTPLRHGVKNRVSAGSCESSGLRSFNQILEVGRQMSGLSAFLSRGFRADGESWTVSQRRQLSTRAHARGLRGTSGNLCPADCGSASHTERAAAKESVIDLLKYL